jgi:hypothetical protein
MGGVLGGAFFVSNGYAANLPSIGIKSKLITLNQLFRLGHPLKESFGDILLTRGYAG